MFVGHFALGFAAKRAAPRTSLGLLFAAAQFADLLWPPLLALGLEQVRIDPANTAFTPLDFVSYPYSHSLALMIVWGAVLAVVVRLKADTTRPVDTTRSADATRSVNTNGSIVSGFRRTSLIVGLLVVSHWFLDWITHRPDLPLYPGGAKHGLGLWNSVPGTMAIELTLFAAGVWIYAASTRARDAVGRWGFVSFVVLLLVIYAGNILGGPPPSVTALWIVAALGGAIFTAWSVWFDRHRDSETQSR